jgi:uncharacterized protein (TIGR03437 family)
VNKSHFLLPVFLSAAIQLSAQGTISTVAGSIKPLDNVPAIQTRLVLISFALDQHGNAYLGDGSNLRVVNGQTGVISTLAPITAASLAVDPNGQLVIKSNGSAPILKINPVTGAQTTIVASNSQLGADASPTGIALDGSGNIFVCDDVNDKVYKLDAKTNAVTTIAGTGPVGYTGSTQAPGDGGPATAAGLIRPDLVTVDATGNIFIAGQYWLRRIDAQTGIITTIATIAGSGNLSSGDGGPYSKAVFGNIAALTTDSQGNLYIGDGRFVREINWSTGLVNKIAGSGSTQYASDGVPALQANIGYVDGIAVDSLGNLWIADGGNERLLVVSSETGLIRTVAGTAGNGDGGPAAGADLGYAVGIAASPQGDLYTDSYISPSGEGIRRIDHITGKISTIAYSQGQPQLGNGESPIAIDSAGNVYVCEQAEVNRIDAVTGKVTVVAGNGGGTYGGGPLGDGGLATNAHVTPAGVAFDSSGNLYIADYWNERIRRVDAITGIITTVAGNGQGQTFSGQTGQATQISIGVPTSIAVGPDGNIYWTTGGWVLRMNAAGALTIAAGEGGGCIYAGDGGSALAAPLCNPSSLAFDDMGNLLITEAFCGCIRRVDSQTGIIQTIAGTGIPSINNTGASIDGSPATKAALTPGAIAWAGGVLYILDQFSIGDTPRSIRAVTPVVPPALPQPPSITQVSDAVAYGVTFSPGAVIALFGNYLGAPTPTAGTITNGVVSTSAGGVQLTINGTAAPLLYISAGQINTVIPYSTTTGVTATAEVFTSAGASSYSGLKMAKTSLALFSNLVFNPDGTLNSATNPAPKGATLVLYGTGIGPTTPTYQDGVIVTLQGPPYPSPVAPFGAVVVNNQTQYKASVAYLGPIPGFVAGAVQANIQIPSDVPPGSSTLKIGPANASNGLLISAPYSQQVFMQ